MKHFVNEKATFYTEKGVAFKTGTWLRPMLVQCTYVIKVGQMCENELHNSTGENVSRCKNDIARECSYATIFNTLGCKHLLLAQKLLKLYQTGEISPNMVTLAHTHLIRLGSPETDCFKKHLKSFNSSRVTSFDGRFDLKIHNE